jgi:hypothetical protein
MPYELIPSSSRVRLMVFAIAAVTFGSLSVSSAKAQHTTWTITVDGTGPRLKPSYTVTFQPPTGGCSYATLTLDPEKLQVCQGDTVNWVAKTKPDPSTSKLRNETCVFQEDPVLDQGATPAQGFHTSDGVPVGGVVDANASPGPHEYYVVVFDKVTNRSYMDDPKIIIGTGSHIEVIKKLLDSIEPQATQLRALVDDSRLGEEAKKQAKQIVDSVAALKRNPGLQ